MSGLRSALIVFRKELVDALRDRRTLLAVLISSVLIGPIVLTAVSGLVATLEERAERRELLMAGVTRAPTLVNFIERQTYRVAPAPDDYEARLKAGKLGDAVIVVPQDFEALLLHGEAPRVEVVSDSADQRSVASGERALQLLAAFNRERAALTLALRGVALDVLEPLRATPRDLANVQTRGAQITGMLPFLVIMAVLYGALASAIDTTAGERERGSLEPLLMNPAERWALVLGKWAAVAAVAMGVAVISCFSFLPAQWLLRSDTLAALFQYGVREALLFLAVLLPFGAALSALLMAIAIRSKTLKEAQATTAMLVIAVSVLPLIAVFSLDGEAPWHVFVPALAQNQMLTRILKGESFGALQVGVPLLECAALTVVAIVWVARRLHRAAVR